jgi:carboxylesterase
VTPRVLAGAEAYRFDGGPIGVLLQHGFTGCPASMRPMGEWMASQGLSVIAPRLPGHGTTWEDLEGTTWRDWEREAESALSDLAGRCRTVVAVGLSMGGALVLHLGAKHPGRLQGVVTINALLRRPDFMLAPLARLFTRTTKGVGNDCKKPGTDEIPYDRVPLRSVSEVRKLLRTADAELPSMSLPLLVFSSLEDHTVKPANSRRIMARAGSTKKEFVSLPNSYHVASLDYDAEAIFQRTLAFARLVAQGVTETTA